MSSWLSTASIYSIIFLIVGFYLPSFSRWSLDFIRQVLANKKKVSKLIFLVSAIGIEKQEHQNIQATQVPGAQIK